MKMIMGIQQKESGLRRAAYIIHCSLVDKKNRADINKMWPLPLDDKEPSNSSVMSRLKQRQLELRQKQQDAS
jgi:hypothetical protein